MIDFRYSWFVNGDFSTVISYSSNLSLVLNHKTQGKEPKCTGTHLEYTQNL